MFEHEEKKLNDLKKRLDEVSIPTDALDDAVMAGFQKAKKRTPYKIWMLEFAAAAILIIGFFTSVRLSPNFASYISAIPGMEKIVEMIRDDKGLLDAVENEYYQEIGVSEEKNGLKVTIDGVIADQTGMVIFYTLDSEEKQNRLSLGEANLSRLDGLDLPSFSSLFMPPDSEEGVTSYSGKLEYYFEEPLEVKDFHLDFQVEGDEQIEYIRIPFSLNKVINPPKVLELNKSITVEGQKLTFVDVTIHPLRTDVHIKVDPNNTKDLLGFEDLQLVNEYGETWNKAGTFGGNYISDTEEIIYLQSNYFREPKELYLALNNIEAIDKDDKTVVVDVENLKILKQPKGNHITDVYVEGDFLFLKVKMKDEKSSVAFSVIKDADGKTIKSIGTSYRVNGGENTVEVGEKINGLSEVKSPLTFEIGSFPAYIEANQKIKIK